MAASVSSVLTLGFGSFSSPELLPTLGFGLGEAAPVVVINRESLEWQALPSRMQFTSQATPMYYQTLPSQMHFQADNDA